MRDLQNRRKVKNIAKKRRDTEEKIIKNYPEKLDILNGIGRKDQNSSHAISLSTNNLRLFAWKQKQIKDADVKKKAHVQSRIQKIWFHPHIWPIID